MLSILQRAPTAPPLERLIPHFGAAMMVYSFTYLLGGRVYHFELFSALQNSLFHTVSLDKTPWSAASLKHPMQNSLPSITIQLSSEGSLPVTFSYEGFQLWGKRKGPEAPHITVKMGFSSDSQVTVSGHSIMARSHSWKSGRSVINRSQHRNKSAEKRLSGEEECFSD